MLDRTGLIDAVVVHWNQATPCVATVDLLLMNPVINRIVVVDNGSTTSERDRIRALAGAHPRVDLIEMGHNSGFGPATNRGWKQWLATADTTWCLSLPHDAAAADGTVEALLSAGSSDPRLGLISADVGDACVPIVDRRFGPVFTPQTGVPGLQYCDYPHGTMFLARRECLADIGLYDERFFTYCEEADLGLRATAAGWRVGLVAGARVINPRVSTPRPVADYLMERNTLLLMAKHFGPIGVGVRAVLSLWHLGRGLVQPSWRSEYWSARARVYALRDAALRRFGPPPKGL